LAKADTEIDSVTEPLAFYQNVSPTKELRDASNEAESLLRDFGVESSMRLDVYHSKVAAEKNIKESGLWEQLQPEDQRLIEKMVRVPLVRGCGVRVNYMRRSRSWTGRALVWPFPRISGMS
jgi:Zn-dependent oligopeptidase